jgi:hypothetical protein
MLNTVSEMTNSYSNSVVKPEERGHVGDLGVDGRIYDVS